MTVKDELVDQLDEEAAREALALLQDLRLPRVLREAPIDDEPETERNGQPWLRRGKRSRVAISCGTRIWPASWAE